MTKSQKIIITGLSLVACAVLAILTGLIAFMLIQSPIPAPDPVSAAAVQVTLPASIPQAGATLSPDSALSGDSAPSPEGAPSPLPPPSATPVPNQPAEPTPTNTRVVTVTVLPTVTPTPANCINNVANFEASGLVTNEQVVRYLSQTIPPAHLDHCRVIEYQPRAVGLHATPISGSFTPMFRQIYVYATGGEKQTAVDILGTLTHEIGHNVHYNLRRDDWESARRWTELYQQSKDLYAGEGLGFVSDYAQFNDYEDFAETYRAYIIAPETLIYFNPDKYLFMRDVVFDGQEYRR